MAIQVATDAAVTASTAAIDLHGQLAGQETLGHIVLIRLGLEPFREWLFSFESPQQRQSAVAPTQCWPGSIQQRWFSRCDLAKSWSQNLTVRLFHVFSSCCTARITQLRSCFRLIARATNGREGIQIFMFWDDWRETPKFHATCEWFGPGWTVVRSPLVHVLSRPSCDDMCCLSISGPTKRLAASIWSCLPVATTLPATPSRRVESPLVDLGDSGTTLQTGQVGGLAAEL